MNLPEDTYPKLAEAGKELPFKVPRHYFEDFPARMQARIAREEQPATVYRMRLYDYLRPAMGLAAAFAAVFMLVYWPVRLSTHHTTTAKSQFNSEDEIFFSLVEQVDDQTFFSMLKNGNASETVPASEIETYLAANYSDFEIFLEIQK